MPVVRLLADDELVVSPDERARARATRAVAAARLATVVFLVFAALALVQRGRAVLSIRLKPDHQRMTLSW